MKNLPLTFTASLLVLMSISSAVNGHSAWVAQRAGKMAVIYGHGASDEAYDPAKLKAPKALSTDGKPLTAEVAPSGLHMAIGAADMEKIAVFGVTFDNGYWTEKADGQWVNEGKSRHPGAKSAGHYLKHVVAMVKPLAKPGTPIGHDLEIVPLNNPLALKVGDELQVRVLFKGRPLPGVEIIGEYTTDPDVKSATTDAGGEAIIKVRNFGLNVVVANHTEEIADNPDADEIGHNASLSFTLFDLEE